MTSQDTSLSAAASDAGRMSALQSPVATKHIADGTIASVLANVISVDAPAGRVTEGCAGSSLSSPQAESRVAVESRPAISMGEISEDFTHKIGVCSL